MSTAATNDDKGPESKTARMGPEAHRRLGILARRRGVTMQALLDELVGDRIDARGFERHEAEAEAVAG